MKCSLHKKSAQVMSITEWIITKSLKLWTHYSVKQIKRASQKTLSCAVQLPDSPSFPKETIILTSCKIKILSVFLLHISGIIQYYTICVCLFCSMSYLWDSSVFFFHSWSVFILRLYDHLFYSWWKSGRFPMLLQIELPRTFLCMCCVACMCTFLWYMYIWEWNVLVTKHNILRFRR